MSVPSKVLNAHLKTIRNIVVKGFAKVDGRLDSLDKKIVDLKTELKQDIENVRTELKGDIENVRTELKGDIENVRVELKGDIEHASLDIEDLAVSTAREFKAVRSEIAYRNLIKDR